MRNSSLGKQDIQLKWLSSYLSYHSFAVSIDGHLSSTFPLSCGVPKGSVLGLIVFNLYTTPLIH